MGHTLFLLMLAIPTENFTAVLDSCFSGAATRLFRVRARAGGSNLQISPDEKSYQEMWLSRLRLSREEFIKRYRAGVAKGVVLAATNPKQNAIDAQLNGFNAGLFTYLLTSYLWQQTSTPERAIAFTRQNILGKFNQTPYADIKVGSEYEKQPIYFINTPNPTADAVVTEVNGNQAKLWLGGVDLDAIDNGTVFSAIDGKDKVTMRSRDGLVGEATVEGVVKPGMLLRKA